MCEDVAGGGTVAGVDLTTNEAGVNGGVGITYNWIGVGTPTSTTVSDGQVFEVEVVDGNGCKDTAEVTYTVNPLPTITAPDAADCYLNDITLSADGGPGATYSWTALGSPAGIIVSGGTTGTPVVRTDIGSPTGDVVRDFEVTVTGSNGCINTATVQVTFQLNCGPSVTLPDGSICLGECIDLIATGSNGTGPGTYTYVWDNGIPNTDAGPVNVCPTTTTIYQVIITDGSGAKDTTTATITVNPLPTATDQTPTALCEDTPSSGTVAGVDLTTNEAGVNGGAGITYNWIGVGTPTSTTVSDGQVFEVEVTDGNGCVDTAEVTYTVNPLPTITAPDVSGCYLNDLTLSADGGPGATYNWTALGSPAGLIISGGTTGTPVVRTDIGSPTGDVVRDFEVTVTDGNGCINTATVQVTFLLNCGPQVTLPGGTICIGECFDLVATTNFGTGPGTYTYVWDNGIPNTDAGPINVCPTTTTVYEVIVTDGAGDKDTTTATVTVNPLPTATDQTPTALCEDTPGSGTVAGVDLTTNEAGVNGGAGITYSWIGVGTPTSTTVSNGQTFDVEVTDGNGCKDTATVTYTVNSIGVGTAPTETICDGESILIGGISRTIADDYDVTIPNGSANGCDSIYTTTLIVDPKDDPSFNYPQTTLCEVDSYPTAFVAGLPGGTFSISGGGTIDPVTGQIDTATTGAGTYIVTYTTIGTCVNTATETITIIPKADATIIRNDTVFCQVDPDVTFSTVEPGGTWTGATGGVFSPTSAGPGTFPITYTIGTGTCGDLDNFSVLVNSNPVIDLAKVDDNCLNEEGSVTANIINGTPPYDYTWDAEDPNAIMTIEEDSAIVNLASGIYTLIVIDSVGCKNTAIVSIEDILENCDFHIFLPNIFSPNGDGKNDIFIVRGKGIKTINLTIYSRWGEKVFETENPDVGWDGRFRGQDMNPAVFVYYVKATMVTNEIIEQKGNVTLVR